MRLVVQIVLGLLLLFCIGDALVILLAPLFLRQRASDVAVVLGNAVLRNGEPSPRLKARLDEGLAVYRKGMVGKVLVSGGIEDGPQRFDEARVMATYLKAQGVSANAILLDSDGVNTEATAANARRALGTSQRVVVITQWFHIARSVLAMRQQGFQNVSAACPAYVELRDPYSFVREMVALPVYALRHHAAQDDSRKR